ncbi:TonB-dependent receptor [Shewanella sp. Scap07]|uniref:TonB-dependent receptor n=1 Tax=Shewanella sp. Scap07 TaxID=2589987 RepID=UPI0015C0D1E1|nr:TonB-dependent receptor [Shewanella sp. Scap07]QLE83729.1 TonB-dependent receptor [Shewanella sp. Scap07]
MIRTLIGLSAIACSLPALANTYTDDEDVLKRKPVMSVSVDYVPAANNMYGVTFAPYHYDPDYSNWGYYIGYARSKDEDLVVEEPGEAYSRETLWRFGLSYTLVDNFSVYGGATAYIYELHSTNNITPLCTDCKPVWEKEDDKTWGAEVGFRYMMDMGLMIGAGYNSATESAVISVGFAM